MRRLIIGLMVAATTALLPAWALAANQEVAERIAVNLRKSGQLRDYEIGIKYQEGTAWLRGKVRSEEQLNTALRLVFQTPGVSRVVNNLTVNRGGSHPAVASRPRASSHQGFGRAIEASTQTVAKLPPVAGTESMAASRPVRSLQQVNGAIAPEQFPRSIAGHMRQSLSRHLGGATYSSHPADDPLPQPLASQPTGRANRVPSSFVSTRVRTVGATTEQLEKPHLMAEAMPQVPTVEPTGQAMAVELAEAQPVVAPQPVVAEPVAVQAAAVPRHAQPVPVAFHQVGAPRPMQMGAGQPIPVYAMSGGGVAPARYNQPHMPNYAWPSYAAHPNYAALTYPKQYSPTAWPYIGPFYPYPQVPLGWRKVTLEWDDGWWMLDFKD